MSILNGELMIDKRQLVSGRIELDMSTISDEFHLSDNNLITHLKSADFFDVEKFPISTFEITKVTSGDDENVKVTGDLTIKGITHGVTFRAKMEVKHGIANATGELIVDRAQWDVRYGSGKFYDNLADDAIADSIAFKMKIAAKK
ncbi:MAG: YceI family protein [Chryseolinea sp.]